MNKDIKTGEGPHAEDPPLFFLFLLLHNKKDHAKNS